MFLNLCSFCWVHCRGMPSSASERSAADNHGTTASMQASMASASSEIPMLRRQGSKKACLQTCVRVRRVRVLEFISLRS